MCVGHQGVKNKEVGLRGLGLRASGSGNQSSRVMDLQVSLLF